MLVVRRVLIVHHVHLVSVVLRCVVSQNVLQSRLYGVMLCKRRGVVHLEGVLYSVLATVVTLPLQSFYKLLPSVGSPQVGIICLRVACIRLAAYSVRQRKQLLLRLKRALIVYTAIHIRIFAFRVSQRVVAVQLVSCKRRCGQRPTLTVACAAAPIQVESRRYQSQRVNLVACLYRAVFRVAVIFRCSLALYVRRRFRYVSYCLSRAPRVACRAVVVAVVHVCAHCQLSALHSGIHASAQSLVARVSVECRCISLYALAVRYNVQYTSHALSVVFRPRVCYHLYSLNAACRHAFQHLARVVAHHLVRFAVHVDFKRARSVHLYLVLTVHCHHWHLS